MEALVDCVCEDARWEGFGLQAVADWAAGAAFAVLGLPRAGFTLCVMGCDDARIAGLNADFRGKPQATNVLSWPTWDLAAEVAGAVPEAPQAGGADDPESLGDIALAWETCQREAEQAAKPFVDHVSHLIVHGVLHLLGYDHIRDADADLMEGGEVRILATLGISDPYK